METASANEESQHELALEKARRQARRFDGFVAILLVLAGLACLGTVVASIAMADARALTLGGLALDIIGVLILGKSLLLSDSAIKGLSSTRWDYNKDVMEQLLRNKYEATVALGVVRVGFGLQFLGQCLQL